MSRTGAFLLCLLYMTGLASGIRAGETIPKKTETVVRQVEGGELGDLPLVEIEARGPGSDRMAILWSGDGGWVDLDKEISDGLAARDIPVVGVNSLKYFWTRQTPQKMAHDLERIIRHYAARWNAEKVVLIGYSMGADVVPFAANRLDNDLKSRVELIALLSPFQETEFEFHLSDWLGLSPKNALPTKPEVMELGFTRLLCIYGREEKGSLCPDLHDGAVKIVALPGAHHFGGDYEAIVRHIMAELK
jgi:type IV secretory pathway VirJ component